MSSTLKEIFFNNNDKHIYKWEHYFEIYERYFSKFRNKDEKIVVVEIGVLNGGSLQMWKKYFGKNAIIYGIDIYEDCKKYEEENINIRIGSQADHKFLSELVKEIPQIDVLIDDGSHRVGHQITTFKYLFDYIKPGGVYLVEDTHTSYWNEYGGGKNRLGTFIQHSKSIIDSLYSWYSEKFSFKNDYHTTNLDSVHFHDSIVVFEKTASKVKPYTITNGVSEPRDSRFNSLKKSFGYKIAYNVLFYTNKILQFFNLPSIILKRL